jgi:hypothetical protein
MYYSMSLGELTEKIISLRLKTIFLYSHAHRKKS